MRRCRSRIVPGAHDPKRTFGPIQNNSASVWRWSSGANHKDAL
jgi:hypothetical protein